MGWSQRNGALEMLVIIIKKDQHDHYVMIGKCKFQNELEQMFATDMTTTQWSLVSFHYSTSYPHLVVHIQNLLLTTM